MTDYSTIRPLEAGDIPAILALFDAVAAEGRWIGTEPGYNRTTKAGFIEIALLEPERAVAFVALDARGALVGQIAAFRDADDGRWDMGMLILQPYRGKGIGRQLLSTLLAWARHASIASISLEAFPHNVSAIGLYSKFGFTQVAYHEKRWLRASGERWDTIEMRLAL